MSRLVMFVYIFATLMVVVCAVATVAFDMPIRMLLADPVTLKKAKWYAGFLSNLTVLTWGAGGLTAIWAFVLLRRANAIQEWQRFFQLAGIFTLVLMLDDLYMFHEEVFPNYLFLPKITGIEPSEKFVVGGYALFMVWFFYRYRATILKTPKLHLILAIGLMAASILLDRGIGPKIIPNKPVRIFAEDCAKYMGVVAWSVYFILSAMQQVLPLIQRVEPVTTAET